MSSKKQVADDLKAHKINFDYIKNNNMDIADLVKMARKNKPGYVEDDSDESYYEEVIEEEVIEDDLSLLRKPLEIPKFHTRPQPKPTPMPPPKPLPKANKKKKKKKEIDNSKLLLLQSAELKLADATKAFKQAVKEGASIVSLLEFMLTDVDWDDDEIEEVDPKAWEPRSAFDSTIGEARSILDRLESAKHDLMGTRNRGSIRISRTSSTSSTGSSASGGSLKKEAPSPESSKRSYVPAAVMHREPSFRIPDLATLAEEESDMETERQSSGDSDEEAGLQKAARSKRSSHKKPSSRSPSPKREGRSPSPKRSSPTQAPSTPQTPDKNSDLEKAKNEFLKFAQQDLPVPVAAPSERSTSTEEVLVEDELAEAKKALMQFAKEGNQLVSKLEKQTLSPATDKPTLGKPKLSMSKSDASAAGTGASQSDNKDEEDDAAKTRNSVPHISKEGAEALASQLLDAKEDDSAEKLSPEEAAKKETEKEIEVAKKMFLEAATQGASLVTALETKISSKPPSPTKKSTGEDTEQAESEVKEDAGAADLDDEVAHARNSFLQLAQQGADLVAKLENKLTGPTATEGNSQSTAEDSAKKELAKAGDSFLEAAKESAVIVERLENKLEDKAPVPDGESKTEGESDITKAKNSLLEAAKEGAQLVAKLETKLADSEASSGKTDTKLTGDSSLASASEAAATSTEQSPPAQESKEDGQPVDTADAKPQEDTPATEEPKKEEGNTDTLDPTVAVEATTLEEKRATNTTNEQAEDKGKEEDEKQGTSEGATKDEAPATEGLAEEKVEADAVGSNKEAEESKQEPTVKTSEEQAQPAEESNEVEKKKDPDASDTAREADTANEKRAGTPPELPEAGDETFDKPDESASTEQEKAKEVESPDNAVEAGTTAGEITSGKDSTEENLAEVAKEEDKSKGAVGTEEDTKSPAEAAEEPAANLPVAASKAADGATKKAEVVEDEDKVEVKEGDAPAEPTELSEIDSDEDGDSVHNEPVADSSPEASNTANNTVGQAQAGAQKDMADGEEEVKAAKKAEESPGKEAGTKEGDADAKGEAPSEESSAELSNDSEPKAEATPEQALEDAAGEGKGSDSQAEVADEDRAADTTFAQPSAADTEPADSKKPEKTMAAAMADQKDEPNPDAAEVKSTTDGDAATETVVTKETKASVRLSSADIQALRAKTADDSEGDSDTEEDPQDQLNNNTEAATAHSNADLAPAIETVESEAQAATEEDAKAAPAVDQSDVSRKSMDPAEAERIMMEQMLEIERQNALIEEANTRSVSASDGGGESDVPKPEDSKEDKQEDAKKDQADNKGTSTGFFGRFFGGSKSEEDKATEKPVEEESAGEKVSELSENKEAVAVETSPAEAEVADAAESKDTEDAGNNTETSAEDNGKDAPENGKTSSVPTVEENSGKEPSKELAKARQSFLAAAQEGANMISQVEKELGDEKEGPGKDEANSNENSNNNQSNGGKLLAKARKSFLAAAKEGAALASMMEQASGETPTSDDAEVLQASKSFMDAAFLVDQLDKSAKDGGFTPKENPSIKEEEVEEEVIGDGVEAAKKAFLQFAKEGATLVSKLENKFQDDYEEEVVEEEEIIEEVVEDEEGRANFLAAAKADFLNFSKGLDKKIG